LKYPPNPDLAFNLSHCGAAAVLAVARGGRLGVDLESLERAGTALKISRRLFSDAERQRLSRCGNTAGTEALKLWVLKESIVKALGNTVWDGLSRVGISLEDAEIGWAAPPPEGKEKDWTLMLGELRGTHLIAVARNVAADRLGPYRWRTRTLGTGYATDGDLDLLLTSAPPRNEPAPL
jgi:4'-phosphopantetheinyl transferase